MKMRSKIGEIIDEQGYKKKYIAEKMDITQSQLSNWISGRAYPPMDKAFK
ncbi:helix-turn-helix domain-containing protein, partial [Priestia megaterium]